MEPVLLTIYMKGIGTILLILGGIAAIYFGFSVYKEGAGKGAGRLAFEAGPIKLKAHSVGSVIMGTAFLWALAAVWLSPNLEQKKDQIRVYSFNTWDPNFKAPVFATSMPANIAETLEADPDALKKSLKATLGDLADHGSPLVELNGKPAKFDVGSIRTLRTESGKYLLTTDLTGNGVKATVAFEPKVEKSKILFVPAGVGTPTATHSPDS